jgi:hypothetical protein
MKKQEKLPVLSAEDNEALIKLSSYPEWNALVNWVRLQKNNIVMESWNDLPGRPDLGIRKARFMGEMIGVVAVLTYVANLKKKSKKEE